MTQPIEPVEPWHLELAERHGAVLTGKPDASEPITVVFSVPAWQAFSRALEAAMQEGHRQALERAAKACIKGDADECAAAIRALIEKDKP